MTSHGCTSMPLCKIDGWSGSNCRNSEVRPGESVEYVTVGSDTSARCTRQRPKSILVSLAVKRPGAAMTSRTLAPRTDFSYSCGSVKCEMLLLGMACLAGADVTF